MKSQRTFCDGCISFANPLVTSIWIYERHVEEEEEEKNMSWISFALDRMRFKKRVLDLTPTLTPAIQEKINHFNKCKRTDHSNCSR